MRRATRLRRSARIARAGVALWLLYKPPDYLRRALRLPAPPRRERTHERAARVMLRTALDLRGVVIKVCQVMATRSDVFPPPFVHVLKQLHDAVPPQPFERIGTAVERELGRPLDAVFSEFERTPLASASLAQV
ncbi:MAG TPA: AarF/UbiB family protein, partial [Myxococcota bacterium]|nr:AarF/UbiB family protein [Myxococcota bacterium]